MISGKTALVGLLGNPVSHSLSPVMQNAVLTAMQLDWCYLALPCEVKDLKQALQGLRALNCKGLNITIPHKENVAQFCSKLTPIAKRLKAVNTLIPNTEGGWTGTNTDVAGFIAPLKNNLNKNTKAIVLGCGGSAKAVVAGLESLNVEKITILGRQEKSLETFLKTFYNIATNNEKLLNSSIKGLLPSDKSLPQSIEQADLIINTTPVGMKENSSFIGQVEMPFGQTLWQHLNSQTTLYDLIYTPRPTAWLSYGNEKGCQIIDGLEMLVQQGAHSMKLWSGLQEIPLHIMRNAAENFLNG